jgi:predicted nucleic acid-binding protein
LVDGYRRPYLDAQCWITALSGTGPYATDLRQVLAAADRGGLVIVTSVLMPLEVLGGDRQTRTPQAAEQVLLALGRSSVVRVAVTDRVVRHARELRLDHGLTSIDALHVASAVAGQADVLLTNDSKVRQLSRYRGIPIIAPEWPGDVPLPGMDAED